MDSKPSEKAQLVELHDDQLDQVHGGIGMLLPAVQAAREAARSTAQVGGVLVSMGDGSVRTL